MLFTRTVRSRVAAISVVSATSLAEAGMNSSWGRRAIRWFMRFVAPALLVLLLPALLWASFIIIFNGVVTVLPTGGITLSNPAGVIVDGQGNTYIADTSNNQIVEVTASGVVSVLAFPGLSPALHNPQAVALDAAGNLFVADGNNFRIVELSGGVASVVDTSAVTLAFPDGVAVDTAGTLYIADADGNAIVRVPVGGPAAVFAITGLGTPLNSPGNIVVDVSGNLYIADAGNNRIVKVTPGGAGTVLAISGGITLSGPLGVAVDRLGNVYIADRNNNQIVTVTAGGVSRILNTGSTVLHFPRAVAVDVSGTVYIADNNGSSQILQVPTSTVGFGHLPVGGTTGTTISLPFSVGISTTLSSVQVLTQGTPNLDFTIAAGAGCASAGSPGGCETPCVAGTTNTVCTVDVTFLPTAPGLRRGALVFFDNSTPPVAILTMPLFGTGDAPLAALSPGAASVISTGGVPTVFPFQLALTGAGDMYVGDYSGSNVVKVPVGGGSATVVSTGGLTLGFVAGVALDGAGNLFISDHVNSRIVVVSASGAASVLTINGLGLALNLPTGVATDLAGNLYITDWQNNRVVEVSSLVVGASSSGNATVLGTGSITLGASGVTGVAVDAAGTVYIADRSSNHIVKVTSAGAASLLVVAGITPALSNPQGVAVDAFGNVYIADSGNNRIVRVTSAGVASVVPILGLPAPTTLGNPFGVSVDPSGNIFIPDFTNNRVVKVNLASAALAFPSTKVGLASIAKTATVTNLGDEALVLAADPTYTLDFSENTADTNLCALGTSLNAGTVCDVSVLFTPQSVGSLVASIVVTDNNLNVSNATQTVGVSGIGLNPGDTTAVAVSVNPTAATIGQPLVVTAIVTDTTTGHTATIPTGGVTFLDTLGSTAISLNGGSPVTLDGAGKATLPGVTLAGAGLHTITANYVGVSNVFLASSNITTLTITKDTAIIAGPLTQPVQLTNGQAGSVPVTITGPFSVVAPPTGSLSYDILDSSSVSVASGSAPLTSGDGNSTATVPIAGTLASGDYTVSVTYAGDANYLVITTPVVIPVVVGQIVPTILWTQPAPISYGVGLSGVLTASAMNGETTIAGAFTYTATLQGGSAIVVTGATVLGAGSYTLHAAFTPTDTTTYTSASGSVSLTVAKATPFAALVSSANPVLVQNAVGFTATVSSEVGTPTGSVSFYDGTTLLGSGVLVQGVATLASSTLAVGVHSITGVYSGDSNFLVLTSSTLTETVEDFDLTIAAGGPTTATVSPGGTAVYDLTIAPASGPTFPAAITLTVTGLPPGAVATIVPQTLPAGSGTTSVALSIQVAGSTASLDKRSLPNRGLLGRSLSPLMLGMLLLPFGGRIRRSTGKHSAAKEAAEKPATPKRARVARLLFFFLTAISLIGLTACASHDSGFFGNRQQTFPLTVTATSGTLSHSTTLTLTIK